MRINNICLIYAICFVHWAPDASLMLNSMNATRVYKGRRQAELSTFAYKWDIFSSSICYQSTKSIRIKSKYNIFHCQSASFSYSFTFGFKWNFMKNLYFKYHSKHMQHAIHKQRKMSSEEILLNYWWKHWTKTIFDCHLWREFDNLLQWRLNLSLDETDALFLFHQLPCQISCNWKFVIGEVTAHSVSLSEL